MPPTGTNWNFIRYAIQRVAGRLTPAAQCTKVAQCFLITLDFVSHKVKVQSNGSTRNASQRHFNIFKPPMSPLEKHPRCYESPWEHAVTSGAHEDASGYTIITTGPTREQWSPSSTRESKTAASSMLGISLVWIQKFLRAVLVSVTTNQIQHPDCGSSSLVGAAAGLSVFCQLTSCTFHSLLAAAL